jgi:hypothetical protein
MIISSITFEVIFFNKNEDTINIILNGILNGLELNVKSFVKCENNIFLTKIEHNYENYEELQNTLEYHKERIKRDYGIELKIFTCACWNAEL